MGGSSLSSSSEGRGGSLSLLSSKTSTLASPLTLIYFSYRTSLSVILNNFNQRSENPDLKSRIYKKRLLSLNNIFGWYPASAPSRGDGDVGPIFLRIVDRDRCTSRNSVAGLGIFLQVITQVVILLNCLARDIFRLK